MGLMTLQEVESVKITEFISDRCLFTELLVNRCHRPGCDPNAAFRRSITRDSDFTGTPGGDKDRDRDDDAMGPMAPPSSSWSHRSREENLGDMAMLSLSGLLNTGRCRRLREWHSSASIPR